MARSEALNSSRSALPNGEDQTDLLFHKSGKLQPFQVQIDSTNVNIPDAEPEVTASKKCPAFSSSESGGGLQPLGALFQRYNLMTTAAKYVDDSSSLSAEPETEVTSDSTNVFSTEKQKSPLSMCSVNSSVDRSRLNSNSPDYMTSSSTSDLNSPTRQLNNKLSLAQKKLPLQDVERDRFQPNCAEDQLPPPSDQKEADGHGTYGRSNSITYRTSNRYKKPKKCKYCDWTSVNKEELWLHLATHVPPEKLLRCDVCPFVTELKHHLESHRLNHTEEKPYRCDMCSYRAVNQSMINSHRKKHFPDRPYVCTFTGCTFRTKFANQLKQHRIKKRHFVVGIDIPAPTKNGNIQRHLAAGNASTLSFRSRSRHYRGARDVQRMLMSSDDVSFMNVARSSNHPTSGIDFSIPSLMAAAISNNGRTLFGDVATASTNVNSRPDGWLMAAAATAAVAAAASGWTSHNLAAVAAASKLLASGSSHPPFFGSSPAFCQQPLRARTGPHDQDAGMLKPGPGLSFNNSPWIYRQQNVAGGDQVSMKSSSSWLKSSETLSTPSYLVEGPQFASLSSQNHFMTSRSEKRETTAAHDDKYCWSSEIRPNLLGGKRGKSSLLAPILDGNRQTYFHGELHTEGQVQSDSHGPVSPAEAVNSDPSTSNQSRDLRKLTTVKPEDSSSPSISPFDQTLPLDLTKKESVPVTSPQTSSFGSTGDEPCHSSAGDDRTVLLSSHPARKISRRKGVAHKLDVNSINRYDNCSKIGAGSVVSENASKMTAKRFDNRSSAQPMLAGALGQDSCSSSVKSDEQQFVETAMTSSSDRLNSRDGPTETTSNSKKHVQTKDNVVATIDSSQLKAPPLIRNSLSDADAVGRNNETSHNISERSSKPSCLSLPVSGIFGKECPYCDCIFRHDVLYEIHMGFHSSGDPWTCRKCMVRCFDRVEFFQHIATVAHQ